MEQNPINRRDFLKIIGSALGYKTFKPIVEPISNSPETNENLNPRSFNEIRRLDQTDTEDGKKKILLTYDDFPSNGKSFFELLDTLKENNAHAVFFFLGSRLELYQRGKLKDYGWDGYDLKRVIEDGHEIASHGWQHDTPLTQLNTAHLSEQLYQTNNVIEEVFGEKPLFFRSPFGACNQYVRDVAATHNLQHVMWNVESGGLDANTVKNVTNGINRVNNDGRGSIILSHMMRPYDLSMADDLIKTLKQNNFETVDLLSNLDPKDK